VAWIKTVRPEDMDQTLREALAAQHALFPIEYATPVSSVDTEMPGIVAAHTLIPEALVHTFSTFGALMSPALPLVRRQHEMIATMVSLTNRCHY
jgi:hypothetical protein